MHLAKYHQTEKTILKTSLLDVNIVGADGAQPIHYAAKYFKTEKHIDGDASPNTIRQVQPVLEEESFGNQGLNNGHLFQRYNDFVHAQNRCIFKYAVVTFTTDSVFL